MAVTRRAVGAGPGQQTVACDRVVLTSDSALPDEHSRADVVVAAFHPELSAGERAAITGPTQRAGSSRRSFVVLAVLAVVVLASFAAADAGLVSAWAVLALLMAALVAFPAYAIVSSSRSITGAWPDWSRRVLEAHERLFPEDLNDARREVTEPDADAAAGRPARRLRVRRHHAPPRRARGGPARRQGRPRVAEARPRLAGGRPARPAHRRGRPGTRRLGTGPESLRGPGPSPSFAPDGAPARDTLRAVG